MPIKLKSTVQSIKNVKQHRLRKGQVINCRIAVIDNEYDYSTRVLISFGNGRVAEASIKKNSEITAINGVRPKISQGLVDLDIITEEDKQQHDEDFKVLERNLFINSDIDKLKSIAERYGVDTKEIVKILKAKQSSQLAVKSKMTKKFTE